MNTGNPVDTSGTHVDDLDKRRKLRCRACWWLEGGRCWNDKLGKVPRGAPAFSGLNGHEITHAHLDMCVAMKKGALSPPTLPDKEAPMKFDCDEGAADAARRTAEHLGRLLKSGMLSNGLHYESINSGKDGLTLSLNYYDRDECEHFGYKATLTWSEFLECTDIVKWASGEEARHRAERKAEDERIEREREAEEEAERLERWNAIRAHDLATYERIKAELDAAAETIRGG